MLKEKCSHIPNVAYLEPKSDWVKTDTEVEITYFYKDELHLIGRGCQKLASPISKKLKAITNSNYLPSITPKKTPNKFVDRFSFIEISYNSPKKFTTTCNRDF